MNAKQIKKINVKQIKSSIGRTKKQISCLKGLGLKRINHIVELKQTPEVEGMINKIKHLVRVEE